MGKWSYLTIIVIGFIAIAVLQEKEKPPAPRPIAYPKGYKPTPITKDSDESKSIKDSLVIKNVRWHKGGFGSVMVADFTIENQSDQYIKDIQITCFAYGKSETLIDRNCRTIYENIPPKKTKTFRKINMGFIHSQTASVSCRIDDWTVADKPIGRGKVRN